MSSPAPLSIEIHRSAQRGELQKVAKWLRKGGLVDALCSAMTKRGQTTTQEACVQALLRAEANTGLLDNSGFTALHWAEDQGHTNIAELIWQHAAPPQPAVASPAASLEAAAADPLPIEIHRSAQQGELEQLQQLVQQQQQQVQQQQQLMQQQEQQQAQERQQHTQELHQVNTAAPLPVEIHRSAQASCRRWSSGCAREGRSTRSALVQLKAAKPQPKPCCTPPQPTTTWRW